MTMVDIKATENLKEPQGDNKMADKGQERRHEELKEKVERDNELEKEALGEENLEGGDIYKEEAAEACLKQEEAVKQESPTTSEEEDNKTRYLRLAADFANYKRRSEKERANIYTYANENLVTDMLDVLDNFDRAFMQEGCENDPFVEGMELIYKQLLDVLQRAGLSEINSKGQPFDPQFHEALIMEASPDCESGQVIEVLKKGYMMRKKVIRPTLVKVAQ